MQIFRLLVYALLMAVVFALIPVLYFGPSLFAGNHWDEARPLIEGTAGAYLVGLFAWGMELWTTYKRGKRGEPAMVQH